MTASAPTSRATPARQPNIVLILADDIGYGDLGCYGQKVVATPNLDRMAAEGLRFTQHYSGAAVCTPSRSCLLTGKHGGHAWHRDNPRFVDSYGFRPEDTTFAEVLKSAGYATALCGKWHLGDRSDSKDMAHHHGFDLAYSPGHPYPDRGWEHWPSHVFLNGRLTPVPGNGEGRQARYMDDLYTDAALDYLRTRRDDPFLLFLAFQGPHTPMDGPVAPEYQARDWPEPEKGFASMVTRLDHHVGRVLDTLRELRLDENTLVLFSSDHGPHFEGGHSPEFFHSRGGLRGRKGELYEGGIRVPLLARWPGTIRAGGVTDRVCANWDFFGTFAELAGASAPAHDGISLGPTLRGEASPAHAALYWESSDRTGAQAVRFGNWKAIRHDARADAFSPFELYDLASDPAETRDVAAQFPDVVQRIRAIAQAAHVPLGRSRLAVPGREPAPSAS